MRRRLLFDASSPLAAAAARLLRDDFDVVAISEARGMTEVVVLTGESGGSLRDPRVRVIAIVESGGGPWPEDWYAILPAGVGRPVLTRIVENAFADLEAAAEVRRLDRELGELNAIGIRLSAERNPDALLETILTTARQITGADAGSLYLIEEVPDGEGERRLRFVLAQNDTIDIPFRTTTLPLTDDSVAGHVALTGDIVNLADAYVPPAGAPFHINRSFDETVGYRTKSMLVVPMRTPKGETLGVVQLINCKPDFARAVRGKEAIERYVTSFTTRHETLVGSLASQAAVALDNSRLYESIRRLFEGFVKASVTAIESRDPTTSGHSFRVAELTLRLAEVVDRTETGLYAATRFSADELMELRYASLLHDFGKVGVREQILVKAQKLYPGDLERIQHRAEAIGRGLEAEHARRKLELLLTRGRAAYDAELPRLDAELAAALRELAHTVTLVQRANEPAVTPRDLAAEVAALSERVFEVRPGLRQSVVTREEARALAIPRGSLTPEEFAEIRQHVVHTFQFLTQIPWTREFRRIPEIARAHHEKLDGSGYPDGLLGDHIPVQSRMMTIADMYDALTAADRPYKKAMAVEAALDILDEERRQGRIDGDLLALFIAAKVFKHTA